MGSIVSLDRFQVYSIWEMSVDKLELNTTSLDWLPDVDTVGYES